MLLEESLLCTVEAYEKHVDCTWPGEEFKIVHHIFCGDPRAVNGIRRNRHIRVSG